MLNLNHLYYFYITAKLKGVTYAARQLHTSQSSLSIQLRTLESQLGRRLLAKVGRNLELTEDGRRVFSYCERMFLVVGDLKDFLRATSEQGRPYLNVGIGDGIMRAFVSDLLVSYQQSENLSEVSRLRILSGSTESLRDRVSIRELDVVFSCEPLDLRQIPMAGELVMPVGLYASPKYINRAYGSWEKAQKIGAYNLLKRNHVRLALLSQGMLFREETDLFLGSIGAANEVEFESNSLDSVVRAIRDDLAMGFIPTTCVQPEVKSGALVALSTQEGLWIHRIYVHSLNGLVGEKVLEGAKRFHLEN